MTGVELETRWQAIEKLLFQANVTVQDSTNNSDIAAFNGEQLPNQSEITAYARATYHALQSWQLWSELIISRDRFFDLGNFLPAEDTATMNLGAMWQKGKLRAELTLNNITNDTIEDFNGFPRPERAVHLGAAYRFK